MSEDTITTQSLDPEWSYLIDVTELDDKGETQTIMPSKDELKALARRFDIQDITNLTCKFIIKPIRGGNVFHIEGDLTAEMTQECVVSAEPVQTKAEESFEAWFRQTDDVVSIDKVRQTKDIDKGDREVRMVEEKDDPEPIIDDQIDIGELCAQYLALAINPYPHAEGIEYEGPKSEDKEPLAFKNPFAGLQEWKDKYLKEEN